jgi:hypothetical protein
MSSSRNKANANEVCDMNNRNELLLLKCASRYHSGTVSVPFKNHHGTTLVPPRYQNGTSLAHLISGYCLADSRVLDPSFSIRQLGFTLETSTSAVQSL